MSSDEIKKLVEEGLLLLKEGAAVDAVFHFEKLIQEHGRNTTALSFLGLATARAGGDLSVAEKHCLRALKRQKLIPLYYKNLAEVYLIRGKKSDAVKVLRKGLSVDRNNKEILRLLRELGVRKKVPVSFLSRSNPINRYVGLLYNKKTHGRRRK